MSIEFKHPKQISASAIFNGMPWNSGHFWFDDFIVPWKWEDPIKWNTSMEFRGAFYWLLWSSGFADSYVIEFRGTRMGQFQMKPRFRGIFHGTLEPPNQMSPSSMEFYGTCHFKWHVLWASRKYIITSVELRFHEIKYQQSQSSMAIQRTRLYKIRRPRGPLELGRCHFIWYMVPWISIEYSMEFHWTLVLLNQISLGYIEFRGTNRKPFQVLTHRHVYKLYVIYFVSHFDWNTNPMKTHGSMLV